MLSVSRFMPTILLRLRTTPFTIPYQITLRWWRMVSRLPVCLCLLTVYNICKLTSAAGCCITLFSTADQTGYCSKPDPVSQPAAASSAHCRPLLQTEAGQAAVTKLLQHTSCSCKNTDTLNIGPTQARQATTSSPTYSTAVCCHSTLMILQQQ